MGNLMGNSRNTGGRGWNSWRLAIDQEQAQKTFTKLGCLHCSKFFSFGKFVCLVLLVVLPIALIVMGSFYIDDCPHSPFIPVFLIVLESIDVFKMYQPEYDPKVPKYCNKTLYMFAFIVTTILWICFGLFLLMCLALVVVLACAKGDLMDDELRQVPPNRSDEPRQVPPNRSDEPRQVPPGRSDEPRQGGSPTHEERALMVRS